MKTMKNKLLALLLTAIMVFTMLPVMAFAAGGPKVTVTADKSTVKAGDTVTFTVSVTSDAAIGTLEFKLDIPEGMSFVEGSGTLLKTKADLGIDELSFTEKPNKIFILADASFAELVPAGTYEMMTFKCTVNDDATGSVSVGVKDGEASDAFLDPTGFDSASASVTVEAAPCTHTKKVAHAANDATCTEAGNSAYWSCPDCGKFFSDEACATEITEGSWVKAALGHNFKGAMKDNGDGKHVFKCTRCDEYGDPESHSGTGEWQKNDTNHWKECACGVKVDEAAHTWDSGIVLKEATCKETGIKKYTCSVCAATNLETIDIAPENHSMTDWGHDESGEYGKHYKHCKNGCGKTEEEACYGGTATCKTPAICEVCGVNYGELGGHTLTMTGAQPASCLENGNSAYWTCSVCHKYFSDAEGKTEIEENSWIITAPGSHEWGEWTVVVPATETSEGRQERACQRDGCTAKETVDIPKLPHTHVFSEMTAEVPATCTTDGTKAYKTCEKCSGKYFDKDGNELSADDIKIPATGHDFDGQPWVTDGESHWHVCKNCTATDTKVAHSSTGDNVATCQKLAVCDACGVEYGEKADHEAAGEWISGGKGSHYKACKWCKTVCDGEHCSGGTANCVDKAVCEICGGEYGDVDPTNHKDPHTTGYVAPTCTEAGETGTGRCEACKQVISESQPINPLGHVWSEPTFTWADDYSSCKATFTCTRDNCGATKDLDCTVTSETTDSTCQDTGKTVYTATVSFDEYKSGEECKDTQKVTLPLADHDYGNEIPEVSATCTENGTKAHFECSVCGKIFVLDGERYVETSAEDLVISATGHAWGEWKTDVEPTYDAEGSEIRVCANDDTHVERRSIPKLVKNDPTKPTGDPTKPVDNKPVDNNNPETGDAGVGIWVAVLTVSALFGTAIVVKKRHA